MHEKERLAATRGSQRVASRGQESAANPAAGVGGMDEEQEHLPVLWMNSDIAAFEQPSMFTAFGLPASL